MNEEIHIKIDRYLQEEMNAEERRAFEQEIAQSEPLQKAVETAQEARLLLVMDEENRIRKVVREQYKAQQASASSSSGSNSTWIFSAAAVVALLVASWWLFFQSPAGDELAAAYFEPYPDRITTLSEQVGAMQSAMDAYNRKAYREAIELFAHPAIINSEEAIFYKGVSQLALEQYKEAYVTLRVVDNFTGSYHDQAHWYLALAAVGAGNYVEARSILSGIVEAEDYKHEEAAALLEALPD